MKKLFLSAAIVGLSLTSFAGNGGGCKGKGCTCTGSCKDEKCTMKCCTGGDKKACTKDGKCTDNTKATKDSKTATPAATPAK